MSPKLSVSSTAAVDAKLVPAALRKLRLAANGPRGSEPLTARGVAELCGVELKTVHNWVTEGLIPHFRTPGRHLRFQPGDVVRFLEACGVSVPASPDVARALVIAGGSLRGRLRRSLKGLAVEFVDEPFAALIVAGRLAPDAIVVACDTIAKVAQPAYLAALRSAFPEAKLFCLGPSRPRGVSRDIQLLPSDKLSLLRTLLGLK